MDSSARADEDGRVEIIIRLKIMDLRLNKNSFSGVPPSPNGLGVGLSAVAFFAFLSSGKKELQQSLNPSRKIILKLQNSE